MELDFANAIPVIRWSPVALSGATKAQGDAPSESLERFIEKAPKAEIHLHTTGSMSAEFIYAWGKDIDWNDPNYIDAAKIKAFQEKYKVDLNAVFKLNKEAAISELNKLIRFTNDKGDLFIYLDKMLLSNRVLYNNLTAYEAMAYDIAVNEYRESNVRYLELRTSVIKPPLKIEQILDAIHKGLKKAENDCPGLKTGIIVCINKNAKVEEAQMIVDTMVTMRQDKEYQKHIIALDTTNAEILLGSDKKPLKTFDPRVFEKQFALARQDGVFITNHAGEDYMSLEEGLAAIEYSVTVLKAIRIGHALALGIDPNTLLGQKDKYGNAYDADRIARLQRKQEELADLLIKQGVTIEVCLSSNLQTSPDKVDSLEKHPFSRWLTRGLKITLATDNYVTSNTTLTEEYKKAAKTFGLTRPEVELILDQGFKASFLEK